MIEQLNFIQPSYFNSLWVKKILLIDKNGITYSLHYLVTRNSHYMKQPKVMKVSFDLHFQGYLAQLSLQFCFLRISRPAKAALAQK